jgi:hypothetical protein
MRRILIVTAVVADIISPVRAQEAPQSGNDLIGACRAIADGSAPAADTALRVGVCRGQIEALNWVAPGLMGDNIRSCVPTGVTRQEMAKAVVDYLDHNRDRLREPFEGLALEALSLKWPCPTTSRWFDKWLN